MRRVAVYMPRYEGRFSTIASDSELKDPSKLAKRIKDYYQKNYLGSDTKIRCIEIFAPKEDTKMFEGKILIIRMDRQLIYQEINDQVRMNHGQQ